MIAVLSDLRRTQSTASTYLFVPAHKQRFIEHALALGAGALVLDLEDAVPPEAKSQALESARTLLAGGRAKSSRDGTSWPHLYVRVNGLDSGRTRDEIGAIVSAHLEGVRLPKVESAEEVLAVSAWLREAELAKGLPIGAVRLDLTIETARGLVAAQALASADGRVRALVFGHADFCRDVGAVEGPDEIETLYARSHLVVVSRAAGLVGPIDGAYARLGDAEGLSRSARLARRLGYSGKSAIHPEQLALIAAAFAPSEEEVAQAKAALAAYAMALAEGSGAVRGARGAMVDRAIYLRAQETVARADADAKRGGEGR